MSTASAAPDAAAAPAAKTGKKKLLIIIGAVVLLLALAGGGAVFYLKSKAAAAAAAEESEDAEPVEKKAKVVVKDAKNPPAFVPLDPFTVNLADRDAERYAQVGMSLELSDPKQGEAIKAYMPVIRNNILMVLAHKTSGELLLRDGKDKLAREIQRETARALGIEVEPEEETGADSGDDGKAAKKKKKKKQPSAPQPIAAVHFSNFIIQ